MSTGPVPLPEGTVTVLSTDLVGSTLLNQRLGDEAATGVERELAALAREQIEKQRGVVIKDTGDGRGHGCPLGARAHAARGARPGTGEVDPHCRADARWRRGTRAARRRGRGREDAARRGSDRGGAAARAPRADGPLRRPAGCAA